MRPKSTQPKKQRYYNYNVEKNENHKLLSAPLSQKLRDSKRFRSLPIHAGDTVRIVRGGYKGRSGKVIKTDPKKQRIYVDKIVNKKTDATEIPVPIHPSNVIIEKYVTRDRRRMQVINRRIKVESEKIDIEATMAEIEAEEEDLIEFEDEDEMEDVELLDEDMDNEEFELLDEDDDITEEDDMEDEDDLDDEEEEEEN